MNHRFSERLARVEARHGTAWMPWAGVPMDQWPDSALHASWARPWASLAQRLPRFLTKPCRTSLRATTGPAHE
jgi:hypothetical protein